MKRVLVTGASGFIGRHTLAPLAALGFEVYGLSRCVPSGAPHAWLAADVLDEGSVGRALKSIRPTHLLHLAWTVRPGVFWEDPSCDRWRDATISLVHQFIANTGERLVTVGSCAEYGAEDGEFSEGDFGRVEATTAYGRAKGEVFNGAQSAAAKAGISYCHARLFHTFGPFERPQRLVPQLIGALLHGAPAQISSGRRILDFLDVRDIGRLLALVLDSQLAGPVNVASGHGVSIARVGHWLGEITNRSDLVIVGGTSDAERRLIADVSRLTALVGTPLSVPIKRSLADAVAWWRRQNIGLNVRGSGAAI